MKNKTSTKHKTAVKNMACKRSAVRLPKHFEYCGETVMSNFDHCIDEKVATEIKGKDLSAQYSGWNFCGYCWWHKQSSKWCCEVWTYGSYQKTFNADTLEEIMSDVSVEYGSD